MGEEFSDGLQDLSDNTAFHYVCFGPAIADGGRAAIKDKRDQQAPLDKLDRSGENRLTDAHVIVAHMADNRVELWNKRLVAIRI